jgi:hypothetical protein
MSRSVILGTVVFASVLTAFVAPTVASAQDQVWLSDRRYTEGKGILVGDFELHPGVGLEFGFDSNYFYRADDPDEDPIGALRLRLTPSFSISTLGPQRRQQDAPPPVIDFRAGIHATYDEFIPVSGSEAGQDQMSDQRNVGGRLDFNVNFFPGRTVSGSVHGGVSRSIEPTNAGDTTRSFNRVIPDGGAEIGFATTGGLFDWRFGYDFVGTVFENSSFSDLNNFNHQIITRGRWRFFPRSALTFDGRFGFIQYPNEGQKTGSHPMRARVGFNGLITKSFAVLAMGGWGASFYEPQGQQDFDSFIGQAEVKWLITPSPSEDPAAATLSLSSLAVGFNRDFADSYIGTYLENNRGYAKFSYFFAGRFLLVVSGGVAAVVFPDDPEFDAFTAIRIDSSVFGEYRFTDYFGVNATVRYDTNITDTVLETGGGLDALQWQDFQAYLGARFMW